MENILLQHLLIGTPLIFECPRWTHIYAHMFQETEITYSHDKHGCILSCVHSTVVRHCLKESMAARAFL